MDDNTPILENNRYSHFLHVTYASGDKVISVRCDTNYFAMLLHTGVIERNCVFHFELRSVGTRLIDSSVESRVSEDHSSWPTIAAILVRARFQNYNIGIYYPPYVYKNESEFHLEPGKIYLRTPISNNDDFLSMITQEDLENNRYGTFYLSASPGDARVHRISADTVVRNMLLEQV